MITEIGGTVGDIEGLPFLEAIRQFALDVGRENCLYIHLTLVPYLKAAGELKTKPTQHSVGGLRQIGIQPDVLICRTEHPISAEDKDKIALFCNVERKAVIEERDKQFSIYEVPLSLVNHGIDEILVKRLHLKASPLDLAEWRDMVERIKNPKHEVRIAVVGKYMKHRDAYKSVYEALDHAGIANRARVLVVRVEAEEVEGRGAEAILGGVDGILVPGGFGMRGIEGKIEAIRFARTRKIPYFGICLGMQCAVVEFARSVLGLEDANSTEFDPTTGHPVIWMMEEQHSVRERGGTMRLGSWPCGLARTAWPARPTPSSRSHERHRHRYELNNDYRRHFEEQGLVATGTSPDGTIVEIMELADHPWFLAVQFHPEFKSKPTQAHPAVPRLRRRRAPPARDDGRPDEPGGSRCVDDPESPIRCSSPRGTTFDSRWVELEIRGERIAEARPVEGPDRSVRTTTGSHRRSGTSRSTVDGDISFSSPDLAVDQVAEIVRAQAGLGTARLCPTLITAPVEHLLHGLRTIASACAAFPDVAARVAGIHLEGPFLSERDGYRGAHPIDAIRDPDWGLFEDLQEASGRRIVLVTLAPERPGAIAFIRQAVASGIVVALGHTAADGATIRAAVEAGARLSTHLGNGIASPLPRHPNPIWEQAAIDELSASFIADGHHLDLATLRVLARAKGPARTILVSDASPLAGLPVGTYGDWAVDPSGKVVVAGTPYLAGSNQGLEIGVRNLLQSDRLAASEVLAAVTSNPARLLGRPEPRLAPGEPANLVIFRGRRRMDSSWSDVASMAYGRMLGMIHRFRRSGADKLRLGRYARSTSTEASHPPREFA